MLRVEKRSAVGNILQMGQPIAAMLKAKGSDILLEDHRD